VAISSPDEDRLHHLGVGAAHARRRVLASPTSIKSPSPVRDACMSHQTEIERASDPKFGAADAVWDAVHGIRA
jgi:hypothetical protein